MMTFTNNLSYYISSNLTYENYNAPPGCSVVSKDNPNLSMFPNADYNESHEENFMQLIDLKYKNIL